jgi:hypothetical protein
MERPTDAENEKITWMSRRVAAWLAWSLCAVSLALYALALLLIFLGRSAPTQEGNTAWQGEAVFLLGFIGMPILGGLIASRCPDNPYGWLWCGSGFGFALVTSLQSYIVYTVAVDPGSLPAPGMALWLGNMGWVVSITLVPFLFLLFPDGRLPSRRWRPVAWTAAAAGAVLLLLGSFRPGGGVYRSDEVENPLGIGGAIGEVIVVLTDTGVVYVLFAAVILSALSLVFRFRRAAGVERQQLKWFAYAAVLVGGLFLSDFLGFQVPALWDRILETVSSAGLYAAVGVAILRHRLYDIDVIVNRTLVYGVLTLSLALVYVGCVVALQYALRALTGEGSQLAVVASTLAIAALFNPFRHRIQSFIDRRFYRQKYDAAKTLEAFAVKLRDETDLDALGDDLLSVVGETMQPEHSSLWLRTPPTGERP